MEYNLLMKTQRVVFHDGFITFVKNFKYIGSWIYFSLVDDFDVKVQLALAKSDRGDLQNFLRNYHIDIYRKYIIFLAITVNILLWGYKSWALCKTRLDSLKYFTTRNIWSILGIMMGQVK